jgi:hypothetical protein
VFSRLQYLAGRMHRHEGCIRHKAHLMGSLGLNGIPVIFPNGI